jgi:iron-sulfur cluster repair protein YtfE (RIC family)
MEDSRMPQIYDLLQKDHREVAQILQKLQKAGKDSRGKLLEQLKRELDFHMKFEEELVYPEVRAATGLDEDVEDGVDEHREARAFLEALIDGASSEEWTQTLASLTRAIEHHVEQEEGELFPAARKNVPESIADDLGEQYEAFKRGDVKAALEE